MLIAPCLATNKNFLAMASSTQTLGHCGQEVVKTHLEVCLILKLASPSKLLQP